MASGQHVLVTGIPGIGKTTLVRSVVDELLKRQVNVSGFYTEEVRDRNLGKRTGFQVVTLEGERATLASIQSSSSLKVGNYGVEVADFESAAIPSISKEGHNGIVVIDEIGKMELFSSKFKTAVESAFSQPKTVIFATLPVPKGKPIPFVEKIRNMRNAKLITVDRGNRDKLLPEIVGALLGT